MISRALLASLFLGALAVHGQDAPTAPKGRELLRARLAEQEKANAGKAPSTAPVEPPKSETAKAIAEGPAKPAETPPPPAPPKKADAEQMPTAVLPKVEVRKGRITELDQQLAKQDIAIAREKRNAKMTDVDKALNDVKIAKPLAILGGESAQFRQQVANARVSLMEDEKDLLEAIAHAKTKEEKAELKKQLAVLRAERRELERSMR